MKSELRPQYVMAKPARVEAKLNTASAEAGSAGGRIRQSWGYAGEEVAWNAVGKDERLSLLIVPCSIAAVSARGDHPHAKAHLDG